MRDIWSFLLQTMTASGVAVLLLLLKAVFRDKLPPRWQFAAWGVLALFLLLPAGWNGRYILVNWPFYVELFRSALTGEYGALAYVAAPIPLPPQSAPRAAADWLFLLYTAGAAALLLRYLISYVRLRLALRGGRPVEYGRVRRAAEEYGLPACPVMEVDGLPSAFICGVFKPVLALPAGAATDEKVILHELLHLKYRDAAWGLVICFFRCLHWCNPLLWYCANRAGNDLESLCDQRVLERLEGEDRRDYGRILLEMADEKYARAPGTSSMANGGKNIRRRIEAIARFKKYPAGMGLVSVCVLLVLAALLAAGTQAGVDNLLHWVYTAPSELAYARTVPCTTYAGAFDAYAKAAMTCNRSYRAMCAPLSEQNALADPNYVWHSGTGGLLGRVNPGDGYRIYNLTQLEEDVYEGILMLKLGRPPKGEEWDSTESSQWMAVQPLRAEKEGRRWVVIPQGEFQAVQGEFTVYGNRALPTVTYEAQWDDFTLQLRYQTASYVNSYEESGGFFSTRTFRSIPQPGGEFDSEYHEEVVVFHTGDPAERNRYTYMSAYCTAIRYDRPGRGPAGGTEVPEAVKNPNADNPINTSYHSSDHSLGGNRSLEDRDWEEGIYLAGGGGSGDLDLDLADAYLASFYVSGPDRTKEAELTLLPTERGLF